MDRQWLPPQPPPLQPAIEPAGPAGAPTAPPERPSPLKRALGPLLVAAAVLWRFGKYVILALKGAKFLTTSLSMLVSVGAYALIWGFPFAIGFVGLLFLHEMGHYVQLRREGVKPSGMLFIPFLGAVVGARSLGGSALAEARVGLAGPVLGSIAAAAVAAAAFGLDSEMLKALAFVGFFLNLFNLLPVVPLDGGRAMAAMAPWMWFVGYGAMVTLMFVWPNPILVLLVIFGGFEIYRRWRGRKAGEEGNPSYYEVRPAHRLAVGAVYVGLIAALALGMDLTYVDRDFGDV
jgi:Zn-dependent protease